MADSLIARLSTVPGLVVRSIGSVRRYARHRPGPAARGARSRRGVDRRWLAAAAWRPVARHRASAPRAPTAAPPGAAASTRNSPASSKCRTRSRRAWRKCSRRALKSSPVARHPVIGARRNTQYRRLPALPGCGSTTPRTCAPTACARACAVPAGARHRPRLCPGLGGACRNPPAHPVRRRRAGRRKCSSRRPGDPARPRRSSRIWPKRVPNRRSSSTGSTSTGRVPSASFGARSRSTRTWPWPTSVWPACC